MDNIMFDRITNGEFIVNTFSVTDKTVFPPDPFTCTGGSVLRDRIVYIKSGKTYFERNDGSIVTARTGDLIYLPYDVKYRSYWDICETGKYIAINYVLLNSFGQRMSLSENIAYLFFDKKKEFLPLFEEIHRKWTSGEFGYKLETRSLFYDILFRMAVNTERISLKSSRNNIYKAILYLENNYLSDVTTSDLAEMINVRECMLRRSFKAEKGMSPVKYRNELRIKKACEMLVSGEFSVIETAMTVGFDDISYFSKLFKRQYGKSPSDFLPKQP